MAEGNREDVKSANKRISRSAEKEKTGQGGKVIAGQRAEFAANPVGDQGSDTSETDKVLKKRVRDSSK